MTQLIRDIVNLNEELSHKRVVDAKLLTVIWQLHKTCDFLIKQGREQIASEGVGYKATFPDVNMQLQILPGQIKDTYSQEKLRKGLGQKLWNEIATVSKTAVTKVVGAAEADKIFALARESFKQSDPVIDIRQITKQTLSDDNR